jgi:D-alanyl-D-alanine carboxypeptidase (penicillin-binding protein 5/6)
MPAGVLAVSREDVDGITTPHMILFEPESQTVLYERDAYSKAYPASTTKIMTFVVIVEHWTDLDKKYTCGDESWRGFYSQSSLLGLKPGYIVTIRDMLYGLMLCSGNDCGACLAVATCGSVEGFVDLMNAKAQELGMTGTHYTNPHGLHDDEHYTTARDMALLMAYALKNETFREVIGTLEYTIVEANGRFTKTIQTSNKLLLTKPDIDWDECKYEYAIGGKTGETNIAGYCLVEAAEKDGVTLIAVLFGDSNASATKFYYRFHSAVKLFEYGFEQYVSYDLSQFGVSGEFNIQTEGYPVSDAKGGKITASVDISELRVKGLRDDLEGLSAQSFSWQEPVLDKEAIKAPVAVGDVLGTATLYMNGKPFYTGDLIAREAMASAEEIKPTESANTEIVDNKGGGKSGDVCNLTVSKNGGESEYTVWVYYKNTMFTMQDGLTWHYLYCDGDVFRAAKTPGVPCEITLYLAENDAEGNTRYVPVDSVESGMKYVVVSQGRALQAVKKGRSLLASPVETDANGYLSSEVSPEMLWTFTANGSGFRLDSDGMILHRSGGDGLLFWILIGVLAIALIIVIRLIATSRSRRRNPRRRGKYKIYRM